MGGCRGELIDDVRKKFGYVIQAVDSIRQRKRSQIVRHKIMMEENVNRLYIFRQSEKKFPFFVLLCISNHYIPFLICVILS